MKIITGQVVGKREIHNGGGGIGKHEIHNGPGGRET